VRKSLGSQRAIALVASIFVLVVVAMLVAAISFAALQEYRMGRNSAGERRALDAAEAGLAQALQDFDAADLDSLAVGDSAAFSGALSGSTGGYAGTVLRLSTRLLLVRSTGRDAGGTSERTLAVLARPGSLSVELPAALVSAGPVEIGRYGSVDGSGAAPEGWDCPVSQDSAPGILIGDSSLLHVADCGPSDCVRGSPSVRVDTAIRGAGVPVLGEAGWAALLRLADTSSGSGASGAVGGSLPIRYAPGDLVLNGGYGQGALLVAGDLSLEGGATFVGVVVTRGRLTIRGAGGRILGAAVAASADLSASSEGESAAVVYSGCAVRRVMAVAARPRPLLERSWATIF